jgi:hypothetical protein
MAFFKYYVLKQVSATRPVADRQGAANRRITQPTCPYCFQRGVHNTIRACEAALERAD